MSLFLSMCKVSARWCSLVLGASFVLGTPSAVLAQSSLTWAKVERLRNRVHLDDERLSRVRAVPRCERVVEQDDVAGAGDAFLDHLRLV